MSPASLATLSEFTRQNWPWLSFAQDWPRYERVLSHDERLELQQLLTRHGYDVGEPDGHLGARTRAAIRDFQVKIGQVPDGEGRAPAPAGVGACLWS